jgi:hypothetical protein
MYLAVVVLLMGVLPAVSIVAEAALSHGGADLTLLIGKWFVFWSVGVRLILAGLRQIADPSFTAESIFGVRDKGADHCPGTRLRESFHWAARGQRPLQSEVDHASGDRGRPLLRAGGRPAPHKRGSKRERDHRNGLGSLHLSRARRLSRRPALPARMSIAGDRRDRFPAPPRVPQTRLFSASLDLARAPVASGPVDHGECGCGERPGRRRRVRRRLARFRGELRLKPIARGAVGRRRDAQSRVEPRTGKLGDEAI